MNSIKAKGKTGATAVGLALLALLALSASAQTAPDATELGPLATASGEYRFGASVDPDIITGRFTEVWARVYRPAELDAGPYPVLIFLHGNHGTCGTGMNPRVDSNCQYTTSGTCPAGFVVVPNHEGYEYVADRLASWGYIVVSINANRGITCGGGIGGDGGLNLARGRLILKHLQLLSEWNSMGGTPPSLGVELQGQLDLNYVGIMGHSRGGEGARAALAQYRDPNRLGGWPGTTNPPPDWPSLVGPANIQAMFEIGAVDGQTSVQLNAPGVVWNQLLPMCDGDVSNLQGVRPFDRTIRNFTEDPATPKFTYTVWGTNHNFYNTEWQQSDSGGCTGHPRIFPPTIGSPQQRQVGRAGMMAFFRGNVGPAADPVFNQNFNPQFFLPDVVTSVTRVDQGYTDSPNAGVTTVFEDFTGLTGTSSYGIPNDASNIGIAHGSVPRHDPVQRAGIITWTTAGEETYFQTNWTAGGEGADISGYATLDLRVSRVSSGLNPADPTNFSLRLVMADDTSSDPVQLNSYADLRGPVGGPGGLHPILQTARVSLADFGSADLTQVRGVRLSFDDTATGAIYVANLRLSTLTGLAGACSANETYGEYGDYEVFEVAGSNDTTNDVNEITSIRSVGVSNLLLDQPGVEIELTSSREFPVRNELAVLEIGDQQFVLSRYPDNGDTHTLIFTLTPEEFAQIDARDPVAVQYGREGSRERWDFGSLDKGIRDQK